MEGMGGPVWGALPNHCKSPPCGRRVPSPDSAPEQRAATRLKCPGDTPDWLGQTVVRRLARNSRVPWALGTLGTHHNGQDSRAI